MSHLTDEYWAQHEEEIKKFAGYLYEGFPEDGIEMRKLLKKFKSKLYGNIDSNT
jgi:hypothetical protein